MGQRKYYAVWAGRKTGVFETWNECKRQISGFPNAKYKSFISKEAAEQAFRGSSKDFIGKKIFETKLTSRQLDKIGKPIENSLSADGAWDTASGVAEYQGVHTKTGEVVFREGPFEDGTNNIVEFLAIVHALAYCQKNNLDLPVYSDSLTAISWVARKNPRTKHKRSEKNKKLFELMDRAVKWLKENPCQTKVLKWETKAWGENPADFGRK